MCLYFTNLGPKAYILHVISDHSWVIRESFPDFLLPKDLLIVFCTAQYCFQPCICSSTLDHPPPRAHCKERLAQFLALSICSMKQLVTL